MLRKVLKIWDFCPPFEQSNGRPVIACIFFQRSFASTRSFTALNTSLWKKTPGLGICPPRPSLQAASQEELLDGVISGYC